MLMLMFIQERTHESPEDCQVSSGLATPVEAARFLRLSRSMIFKLIAERKIPVRRYGRAVRVPWRWLRTQVAADSATPSEVQ